MCSTLSHVTYSIKERVDIREIHGPVTYSSEEGVEFEKFRRSEHVTHLKVAQGEGTGTRQDYLANRADKKIEGPLGKKIARKSRNFIGRSMSRIWK